MLSHPACFHHHLGRLLLAVLLPLTGCALHYQADRELDDLLQRYERELTRAPVCVTDRRDEPGGSSTDTPTSPMNRGLQPARLSDLITDALERNPDLLAAIETAHSRIHRIPQATALNDPMLMTRTLPEPTRTAEGDMVFVLGVTQELPVPQKLDRRGRAALEEARMAIQEVEQVRLRVIGDVKRAWFRLYVIERTISITEENRELLRGLIDVIRGELTAGRRPQQDLLRAQVEHSNLENELIQLRQERVSTTAALNALRDYPPDATVTAPEEFETREVVAHLDRLLEQALAVNPELAALSRQIARDEHALELARLEYWPNFTVGFEWMLMEKRRAFVPPVDPMTGMRPPFDRMSEKGTDSWAIMAGLNLPVWIDRIEAGIRESRHRLSATRQQYAGARTRVFFRVQDALARVRAQRDLVELFRTTILPEAQQAYELSWAGYTVGASDFQFVIDNWQKWLAFRVQYHRALSELERSIADLEEAVGVSIVEIDR
jgi:cobalt-zinc-cadmium efflux system outer membrane protein